MVLTLGVIIAEAAEGAAVYSIAFKDFSLCKRLSEHSLTDSSRRKWEHDCEKLQKAHPWYLILLFTTDIVLVLAFLVILVLVVDWILLVAPVILLLRFHVYIRACLRNVYTQRFDRPILTYDCRPSSHAEKLNYHEI